jgi:hypothetical protein
MTARKPAKTETLIELLDRVPHRRTHRYCAACTNPADAELIEVLEAMAAGTLRDKSGRPSVPSAPILYQLFRARAEALGVPYTLTASAHKRHVTECHRELWNDAQARR